MKLFKVIKIKLWDGLFPKSLSRNNIRYNTMSDIGRIYIDANKTTRKGRNYLLWVDEEWQR